MQASILCTQIGTLAPEKNAINIGSYKNEMSLYYNPMTRVTEIVIKVVNS